MNYDMNQTLRHLDNFEDGGGGPDRIDIIEAGPVSFGIALCDKAYDGFVGAGLGDELLAPLATYRQRRYSTGIGNGISNGQNGDYTGQLELVIVVPQVGGFVLQIVLNIAGVLDSGLKQPGVADYEIFKVICHFHLLKNFDF